MKRIPATTGIEREQEIERPQDWRVLGSAKKTIRLKQSERKNERR